MSLLSLLEISPGTFENEQKGYYLIASLVNNSNITNGNGSVNASNAEPFVLKMWVLVVIILAVLFVVISTYCFFCSPSKNKRKIYAMMQEAKLEEENQ